MATGFLENQVCFESLTEATNSYFSGLPVVTRWDASLVVDVVTSYEIDTAGIWQKVTTHATPLSTQIVSTSPAIAPLFPACLAPSEQYNDGLTFGFLLVTLIITPWLFSQLKKAFF